MALKDNVLLMVENTLEKIIETNADALADKAVDALKQAVPNDLIDGMIEGARAKFRQHFKKFLLEQVEKISPLDNQPVEQVSV